MDPLSDVLSLLRPRSYMFRGLDVAGRWSIRFPASDGIRCYAVLSGECRLTVEGARNSIRLSTGDCVLLTKPQAFCLANDTTVEPIDAVSLVAEAPEGGVVTLNGGGGLIGVGGYFTFKGPHAGMLLALLPAVVHIRKEADRAALRWSMEMTMRELREPQPGGSLVAAHLVHTMLILALRLHIAEGSPSGVGWLFALTDKRMAAALNAMHGDPARRWTLQSLAELASLSRSTFAVKFKETVGEPPIEYLVRLRMMRAADMLAHSRDSVSDIAYSVGYESDSAFSVAFRRIVGCSPRRYVRSIRALDADPSPLRESDRSHRRGAPPLVR